jgi:hypothetical protein
MSRNPSIMNPLFWPSRVGVRDVCDPTPIPRLRGHEVRGVGSCAISGGSIMTSAVISKGEGAWAMCQVASGGVNIQQRKDGPSEVHEMEGAAMSRSSKPRCDFR